MNACRKYVVLTLLSFLFFGFAGCGSEAKTPSPFDDVDTLDGVWIEVKPETVSSTGTEIVFHNSTDRDDLFFGVQYIVEESGGDGWYTLPEQSAGSADGPLIDLHIPTASAIEAGFVEGVDYHPDSQMSWRRTPPNEMHYNWKDVYGELPPGDYRILIEVCSEPDLPQSGDLPGYYLSAPFSITE